MILTEEYLDSVNERFPYLILKYFENINICKLQPNNIDKKNNVIFQIEAKDIINNIDSNIIQLNNNDIYVVLTNIYNPHFYHSLQEFIVNLEIYIQYFSNLKIICFEKDINNEYFQLSRKYFNIPDENILILNNQDNNTYNGNFLYLHMYVKYKDTYNLIFNNISSLHYEFSNMQNRKYLNCYKNIDYLSSKYIYRNERIIISKLIEEANNIYKNTETYDKIWISRRNLNIDTYKHKRFITNIDNILPLLNKNNFIEIILGEETIDFLKQIYIINNASIIFTEMGTAFTNINFMKKNSKFITTNYHHIQGLEEICDTLCKHNEINFYIYNNIIDDFENPYYLTAKECIICPNVPIKINNIDNFNNWFQNILTI